MTRTKCNLKLKALELCRRNQSPQESHEMKGGPACPGPESLALTPAQRVCPPSQHLPPQCGHLPLPIHPEVYRNCLCIPCFAQLQLMGDSTPTKLPAPSCVPETHMCPLPSFSSHTSHYILWAPFFFSFFPSNIIFSLMFCYYRFSSFFNFVQI